MLTIRLTRKGKKNQPFFRVVVIDKRRSSKGGRAVEEVGYVDPLTKRKSLKKERILHWISKGAQPSATIHNLLVREQIIKSAKINKSKKPIAQVAPAPQINADSPAKVLPVQNLGGQAQTGADTSKAPALAPEKAVETPPPAEVEKEEPKA